MDWDEIRPQPIKSVTVGESLLTLSVSDLEERIKLLEGEIQRVKTELAAKKAHEQAAAALFKR